MLRSAKKYLQNMDKVLLGSVLALIFIGILLIASATHANIPGPRRYSYVLRQAAFVAINLVLGAYLQRFDYRVLKHLAKPLYIFNLVMLLAVMFFGKSALGAQRWLQIGPISLQPSEFSKAIMIISLSAFVDQRLPKLGTFKSWLPVFGFVFAPFFLVMRQPDLGTSLVFLAILLGTMVMCGFRIRYFLAMGGLGLASAPLVWRLLHEYQRNRIRVFLNPGLEPYGSGYHVIQSMIAIGSGLFFGRGLFGGTQSQLNFLPENHTDFIFAVAGEEFGFVGVTIILILYFIVIYRGISIAMHAADDFGTLLAVGVVSMLSFHILVNVGMTSGVMPVTGVPLPFMSYGVSSLTTNMLMIALLLNIHAHPQKLRFI
ncbi:MAG: rod shape-determining protein RodA [Acidaminococcus sp.]|jgi:rod shape determining protein RodA|nr:rod shape-determining protein RodA [Acidaminococcus sp.]MCI2100353.1 rod shape-determining protein RodA [Acidaminococcus sp.]MCI2114674.1 rod shape-determining protein RodA [Acidaminococcus sp.]MCI2116674.1 rod shape-determining protein RodA [Acidaminococcus sp.]